MTFAHNAGDARLLPIHRRITAPLRVAVRGRPGVGWSTVAAALAAAGVAVVGEVVGAAHPDIEVIVIAEVLKPEDRAQVAAAVGAGRPVVIVLNKADLLGAPKAAQRRAAGCRAMTGVPTVPMVALLATTALDEDLLDALQALAADGADLTSTDAFVQQRSRVSRDIRKRLLATLDRYGIGQAMEALAGGVGADALPALMRRLSDVDQVVAQLDAAGAPMRYRRVRAAISELRSLAMQSGDQRLLEFLSGDGAVLAVMGAAVDVVAGCGLTVDRGEGADAHLRRAVRWRHYSRGPVNALHRNCGADISRGSLRLLERTP